MAAMTGRPNARAAVWALAGELDRRGVRRLYASASGPISVLSVCLGVTVWCDGRRFWWHLPGETVTWPAADPAGAAAQLVMLARHTSGRAPGPI